MSAVIIEWATTDADLDGVMEVDKLSFSSPWTRPMYEAELDQTGVALVAVLRTPTIPIAGYCSFRVVVDELHINNVAVRPECRRRGFGRNLIRFALKEGRLRHAAHAFLDVRRSNEAARRLYRGLGFSEIAVRRGYYALPTDDAIVMTGDVRFIESDTDT